MEASTAPDHGMETVPRGSIIEMGILGHAAGCHPFLYEVLDLNLRDPDLLLRCAAISRFHAVSGYGRQEHRAGQGRKIDGNDLEQHAHLRKRPAKRACSI